VVVEQRADEERFTADAAGDVLILQVVHPIEDEVGARDALIRRRPGNGQLLLRDSSLKWAMRWNTSARPVAPPPFIVLSERISCRRT